MYRHHYSEQSSQKNINEIDKQIAFHEAGHAAAIYLRNNFKQLPSINFEIHINKSKQESSGFSAQVVNGLLVQDLPQVILDNLAELNSDDHHSYQQAYEADVVNLLAGPIAEAKYVSIRDDEILNKNLLTIQALYNYGGHKDLERAYSHLMLFIANHRQREAIMRELFLEAFSFVNNADNWQYIEDLANFILNSKQDTLSSDDVNSVFQRCAA